MGKIDLQFIEEIGKGDEKALDHVRKLCYSHINPYTQDDDISKELVDAAIEKIIKALKRYNPKGGKGTIESNFRKWLKRIAINTWLDYREKRKREIAFSELSNMLGITEEDSEFIENDFRSLDDLLSMKVYERYSHRHNPLWNVAVKEVINVFNKIENSRKRIAVILKYVYGMKTTEIALIMRENFDAIQTTIHRSRKELRKEFESKGIDKDYLNPGSWRV